MTSIGVNLSLDTQKRMLGNLYITKKTADQEEGKAYPLLAQIREKRSLVLQEQNLDNGWVQSGNDILTEVIGLGVTGIAPDSLYMQEANNFISDLKKMNII